MAARRRAAASQGERALRSTMDLSLDLGPGARPAPKPRAQPTPFGRAWIRPVETFADGRTTSGYLITGKAGRMRPAIVGIAGNFRPATVLFEIAKRLSAEFDLLLVDIPGFNGTGPAAAPSVATFASHVGDLVAAELEGREILLLGESFGGVIALASAARLGPARVRAIATVDPPISAATQAKARAYLRRAVAGMQANAFLSAYLDGQDMIRDADGDGYLGLLRNVAGWARLLVLAGGRTDSDTMKAPATLNVAEDEMAIRATGIGDLSFVRFPEAGHAVLEEAENAADAALKAFLLAHAGGEALPVPRDAAAALAAAPGDAGVREKLLQALGACLPASRFADRDVLLPLMRERPDDVDLSNEILRTVYTVPDGEGVAALRAVLSSATDANALFWARLHLANMFSSIGDIDAALVEMRALPFAGDPPPRIASLMLNLELYETGIDDAAIARMKERSLRRIRARLPAEIRRGPALARSTRPRVGFISGCFGSRNYSSLLVPLLEALAARDLDIELLSPGRERLDVVRAVLPARIGMRELGVLGPEAAEDPAAWASVSEKIAAHGLDLLIDLDDSLTPWSPGCVAGRPARIQATWFNMSGPSLDPCFDVAIGPDALYPASLDAAFPGRIARLSDDLYVFAPEIWGERYKQSAPDIGPPPVLRNGFVTFGSLSNLYKVSDACIALWAKVLHAVPDSRLFLGNSLANEPAAVARIDRLFACAGIDPARIEMRCRSGWPNYLSGYSRIDVVLGTLPVAGGMTLFEAVHLGMPALSRVAPTSLGRIGRWIEAAVGRPGIAHDSDESFVAEAVRLAASPDELARLRRDEPARLRAKSAVDSRRMAMEFERIVHALCARA
jgi:protein O-GlcNAc transferase